MKAFTKKKVEPLIEKYQRTLTLEDVDAIVELDEIAGRIQKGAKQIAERDWFEIDGHFFRKPTFARDQLIKRIIAKHRLPIFHFAGVLYALDMDTENVSHTPSKAELIRYMAKLDVNIKSASRAIEELFNDEDDDEQDKKPESDEEFDAWHLCAVLAREIGGSPEEWYDASPQKIASAVKAIDEKIEAESKAMSGKPSGPPKETKVILAMAEFKTKLNELEASWQG